MLRRTEKDTGRTREKGSPGEPSRAASRERDLRDWKQAVDKGYRNKAIEERLRK